MRNRKPSIDKARQASDVFVKLLTQLSAFAAPRQNVLRGMGWITAGNTGLVGSDDAECGIPKTLDLRAATSVPPFA